ncbi:hypothetical protein A6U98_00170 [Rhizobium sp. WYCCWR10014]|nr:hypothetical protein A6U98_00170 [Rhizobium sp. WYCCWR10014]
MERRSQIRAARTMWDRNTGYLVAHLGPVPAVTHRKGTTFLDAYLEAISISDRLPLLDAIGHQECS